MLKAFYKLDRPTLLKEIKLKNGKVEKQYIDLWGDKSIIVCKNLKNKGGIK